MTKRKSRVEYALINLFIGGGSQIFFLLLSFFNRTVFLWMLGKEYLGIESLFTDLLLVLSLADLGLSQAISFSLYKHLTNENKMNQILRFSRTAFLFIAVLILFLGSVLTPFLTTIIKKSPTFDGNLEFIYLLYLLNTVITYLFSSNKIIFSVHQKEYVQNITQQVFFLLQSLAQFFYLYVYRDFLGYLIIQLISTLFFSLFLDYYSKKSFPYLKHKPKEKLSKKEKSTIFTNMKSLAFYKLSSVVMHGTDSIIITSLLGLQVLGIYSNYLLITKATRAVIIKALSSLTGTIGNLNATNDSEKQQKILMLLLFIIAWIYFVVSISMYLFFNAFIQMWLGSTFLLNKSVVAIIVINFYVYGMQFPAYSYRVTMGLFVQGRYIPILMTILSIGLSVFLGNKTGISGVILGSVLATLLTTIIFDPLLVYREGFKTSPRKYYVKFLKYALTAAIGLLIANLIIEKIHYSNWFSLISSVVFIFISLNLLFLALFFKTDEFQLLKKMILNKKMISRNR